MAESRNPYAEDDGVPRLKPSVLVLMDVLGYTQLIRSAQSPGLQQELLERLHGALTEARATLEDKNESFALLKEIIKKDPYALKAFTDNIVIAWPIHDDAESEIGSALSKVTFFQFDMARRGFFVRGAISIGDAYVDDIAVFGDALADAYVGETSLARDPRIILTHSTVSAVRHHLKYYGNPQHAPQTRELLCDSDGQWFVNYLECVLIAEDENGPFYKELLEHKEAVEKQLSDFRSTPPIFAKYAWVAGYHNYFCDLHPEHFEEKHRIKADLFRADPKRIVD